MYCTKCGKENKDGARFCAYCGAEFRTNMQAETSQPLSYVPRIETPAGTAGIKASDILLLILYIIWVIPWTLVAARNYESTKTAFDLLDKQAIAMFCYLLPYILMLAIGIVGIVQIFKHKNYITLGILAMILSIVAKIGQAIFNETSFETMELIGYRVFLVYGHEWIPTLVLGVILTVFLYAKKMQE